MRELLDEDAGVEMTVELKAATRQQVIETACSGQSFLLQKEQTHPSAWNAKLKELGLTAALVDAEIAVYEEWLEQVIKDRDSNACIMRVAESAAYKQFTLIFSALMLDDLQELI